MFKRKQNGRGNVGDGYKFREGYIEITEERKVVIIIGKISRTIFSSSISSAQFVYSEHLMLKYWGNKDSRLIGP